MPRERSSPWPPDTSPRTMARRGPPPLTPAEIQLAKRRRDEQWSFVRIGREIGKPWWDVKAGLFGTRSKHPKPKRTMIGTTPDRLPRFDAFKPRAKASRGETLDELMWWAEVGKAALAAGFRPRGMPSG